MALDSGIARTGGLSGRAPEARQGACPHRGRAVPVQAAPGAPGWLVLGYRDALDALRDRSSFSAAPRLWDGREHGRPDRWWSGALEADGERHRRLRAAVSAAAARTGTGRVAALVRTTAAGLLDRVAADGRADLAADYADPFPSHLLNALFGLDSRFGALLAELAARTAPGGDGPDPEAEAAVGCYFRALVRRRRAEPGDDLASALLAAPEGLSDAEAGYVLERMWRAGAAPTSALITGALSRLLHDPEARAAHGGALPGADELLDRALWAEPPLGAVAGRYCARDTRIGDAVLRTGQAVLIALDAAQADPALGGAGPAAGNRAHLMWGAGAHACPARSLAREIAGGAVQAAVDRFPGMRPAVRLRPGAARPAGLPVLFPAEPRPEPAEPGGPTGERPGPPRFRIRRPRPQGARYQAPAASTGPEETGAVPAPRRPRPAPRPRGAGARYQAPAAPPEEPAPAPDPLDALLASWRRAAGE
ncbi:cytochrome P450 [Nocardiopsis composta]|uniref:Cytochrome P450 n=1 Tax=Nocardiopsis composta TaxID=157465 RepID=A0A7W8VHB5_9ACTN|nr:cytochrome P450 [Nocardiopsis composta]MBB5436015.1 cytochrome P450 [Nocardiopsis composta]